MNVNSMRWMDLYLGKPLTFISTWLLRIGLIVRSKPKGKAQRVLLIELSEMGSTILVDPAMQIIKQRGADVFFAIFAKNKPSLDLLGTVPQQNIFCIRESSLLALAFDTLGFLLWTRKHRIDAVIDLELFSRFTALLVGWSGAKRRVGFYRFHNEGLYRGEMLSHKVAYNPHAHITKNFLALVHALYADVATIPFAKEVFVIPPLVKRAVDQVQLLEVANVISAYTGVMIGELAKIHLILINSNASEMLPQRLWPQEKFVELISMLLGYSPKVRVLLTGSPQEKSKLDELAKTLASPRCINFAGAIELLQLPSLYQQSALMITNDSGPAHFAAVTDMPTIVLFGPETPELYSSLGNTTPVYAGLQCSPCVSAWNHRKTACDDNQCLKVITPQQVFTLAAKKLELIASS